jgi:integrase
LRCARKSEFDLELGKWYKPAKSAKNKKMMLIDLDTESVRLLRMAFAVNPESQWAFVGFDRKKKCSVDKPISRTTLFERFKEISRCVGFDGLQARDLRTAFASTVACGLATEDEIATALGNSPEVAKKYYILQQKSKVAQTQISRWAALLDE